MAYLIDNDFSTYYLTDDEETQGQMLTLTQRQVIQNLLAKAAEEKINLTYTPESKEIFLQQEASLKGQMDILRFLLASSDAAEENYREIATANNTDNTDINQTEV